MCVSAELDFFLAQQAFISRSTVLNTLMFNFRNSVGVFFSFGKAFIIG